MITLRDYQKEAIEAAVLALKYNKYNPCIVAPTGSGKSIIIAFLIKRILEEVPNARFLILTHIKELIVQNYQKIKTIMDDNNLGIFCAGLNKKESDKNILFGSMLSCVKSLPKLGQRDCIIIDEAHRLNPEETSSYKKIIYYFNTKVVGLTATPFRTKEGSIVGDNNVLGTICYDISIENLIKDGYISKPITKDAINRINTDGTRIKKGDFDLDEVAEKMTALIMPAINEIVEKTKNRKYFICFCCTIEHAKAVCTQLNLVQINSRVLHSKLPKTERDQIIQDFRDKKYRCLVNVNILTEGFDAPFVDCIILMRATISPGLYCQMVGRGFRIDEGKKDFLVLDYGENVRRHGCIDDIQTQPDSFKNKKKQAPVKICPLCQSVNNLSAKKCKDCDYEFVNQEERKIHIKTNAEETPILSSEIKPLERDVSYIDYQAHYKADKPPSLKIIYYVGDGFVKSKYYEYICLYHNGFVSEKAKRWWLNNIDPLSFKEFLPWQQDTINILKCVEFAKKYSKKPNKIKIRKKDGYWNVIGYSFP